MESPPASFMSKEQWGMVLTVSVRMGVVNLLNFTITWIIHMDPYLYNCYIYTHAAVIVPLDLVDLFN